MPELPEVETTRRGIEPALLGHQLRGATIRDGRLRWPVPATLPGLVADQQVLAVQRRAKYLLLRLTNGAVIVHLGMSGRLRVVDADVTAEKHDHVDLIIDSGRCLRLNDPRRFGAVLWSAEPVQQHPLLASLGPEPFDAGFNAEQFHARARGRSLAVKNFLMDAKNVVGVGNIYASEALFMAGIDPRRAAGKVSRKRMSALVDACRDVLRAAVERGGTTLRDYLAPDGEQGWFGLELNCYGREGQPCPRCRTAIRRLIIGQRSSFFCPRCQR